MNKSKRTIEEVIELFKSKHLTITGTYKNTKTPVQCTCDICGNTHCCPCYANLKNNNQNGCRICAMVNRAITNTEKYGGPTPMSSEMVRVKQKQSLCNRTEIEIKETVKHRKQTCLEKYGVEHVSQNDVIKEKAKQTCLDRYGVVSTTLVPEVRAKQEQTCLDKYGLKCALRNKEVNAKVRQTNLERYGVENAMQNKDIQAKAHQTNLERYGVKHPLQYKPFADKSAKAQNAAVIKKHWKTGEDIVCIASYEAAAVDYWNANHINFIWQKYTFDMPNGNYYTPDAYLPDTDTYVEVKGYFWGDAEEKWEWFHSVYPNSELWNKDRLQKLSLV